MVAVSILKIPQKLTYKINLLNITRYLAYDVITELGFGESMGFVRQGQDVGGLIKCFHYALPAIGALARLPILTKMIVGWDCVTAKPTDKYGLGPVMAVSETSILHKTHILTRVDVVSGSLYRTAPGNRL